MSQRFRKFTSKERGALHFALSLAIDDAFNGWHFDCDDESAYDLATLGRIMLELAETEE